MIKLPVDPYYINAATWWLNNRECDNNQFQEWLQYQGVITADRETYYPWLDFDNTLLATLFKIKWSDTVV
jgi:hypothetical protein